MQTKHEPNVWRTIVLVVVGLFAGFFLWKFLWNSSTDMQGFVVGIVFGAAAAGGIGYVMGRFHSHEPQDRQQEVEEAYTQGRSDGYNAGVYACQQSRLTQDGVWEVVVPQQRELVLVSKRS